MKTNTPSASGAQYHFPFDTFQEHFGKRLVHFQDIDIQPMQLCCANDE
jgi:hypothetical protein